MKSHLSRLRPYKTPKVSKKMCVKRIHFAHCSPSVDSKTWCPKVVNQGVSKTSVVVLVQSLPSLESGAKTKEKEKKFYCFSAFFIFASRYTLNWGSSCSWT